MPRTGPLRSLFSQNLDRAVFTTYFLGSVVPTAALALVMHQYVLPAIDRDGATAMGMLGAVLGVGALSLAAFFALRRLVGAAVARMAADNERLASIVAASRELAVAADTHGVAATSAACALELTRARATYVLLQAGPDKPLLVCESAGSDPAPIYQAHQHLIGEVLESATSSDRPALLDVSDPTPGAPSSIAVIPLSVAGGLKGAFVLLHTEPGARFEPDRIDAVASLAGFSSVAFQSADLQNSQRNFFSHVTDMLVAALDAQLDPGDGRVGHAGRVAALANSIGREMGLDDEPLQRLHFAALLHDIGYLKIDRSLHYDAAQCRNHPALGHRMLSRIRLWQDVAPIVLSHHEWFDGSGYPESRAGSDIPIESRILGAADAFDKRTHEDFDCPAVGPVEALAEMRESAGRQFDPRVVDALAVVLERGEIDG